MSINTNITSIDISNYDTISLDVNLSSGTEDLSGLDLSNFEIEENGIEVEIDSVSELSSSELNRSIVVCMDYSGSMSDTDIENQEQAVENFFTGWETSDRAGVIKFASDVQIAQTMTNNETLLRNAANEVPVGIGSMTSFYDSIYEAVDNLLESESSDRFKIVVGITDGSDTASSHTKQEAINKANENNVAVYTIGVGDNISESVLQEIANDTGGTYIYASDSSEIEIALNNMGSQTKYTYRLTYTAVAESSPVTVEAFGYYGGDYGSDTISYEIPIIPIEITSSNRNVYNISNEIVLSKNFDFWVGGETSTDLAIYIRHISETRNYWEYNKEIGVISAYAEKEYGTARISQFTIELNNTDDTFNFLDNTNIFYSRVLKLPIKVVAGRGEKYESDVQSRFQGVISRIQFEEDRTCRLTLQDNLIDLMDAELEDSYTLNENYVDSSALDSLHPIDIIRWLIDDVAGIEFWDFEYECWRSICDSISFETAKSHCPLFEIEETTLESGDNIMDLIQELLKIIGGFLWVGRDGMIKIQVRRPADPIATIIELKGNETNYDGEIISISVRQDLGSIYNWVKWTYGDNDTEYSPADNSNLKDTTSISIYGQKSFEINTKFNIAEIILESASSHFLANYSSPYTEIELTVSMIKNSKALDLNIGDLVKITDDIGVNGEYFLVARQDDDILNQKMGLLLYREIIAKDIIGKYGRACSDIDEGDGYGVTADDFSNWQYGFAYICYPAEVGNPAFDLEGNADGTIDTDEAPLDIFGNSIEEPFILW